MHCALVSALARQAVQKDNLKKLPTLLMAAILEEAAKGELNKDALVAAGLERVKDLKEEIREYAPATVRLLTARGLKCTDDEHDLMCRQFRYHLP